MVSPRACVHGGDVMIFELRADEDTSLLSEGVTASRGHLSSIS